MDRQKVIENVDLALEALRDLEEAIPGNDRRTLNLKTEVLRQALFNILELARSDGNHGTLPPVSF
jgi:hypothetical protein